MTVQFVEIPLDEGAECLDAEVPEVGLVLVATALHFGLRERGLPGPSRSRCGAFPRPLDMYLARTLTDASLPEIGRAFGRDHTTVLYAVRKVAAAVEARDPRTLLALRELKVRLVRFHELRPEDVPTGGVL